MHTVLLVLALSADVFVASVACGAEHIRIGKKTALCISLICSGVLFFALVAGKLMHEFLREETAGALGFAGLLLVGIYKLAEYGVKVYLRKHPFLYKRIKITFSQLQFVLSICNNPAAADRDRSASMSVAEGAFFALAMSMDGFLGGIGASFLGINIWITTAASILLGYAAVKLGSLLGTQLVLYSKRDFSWVSGVLFVILALSKVL